MLTNKKYFGSHASSALKKHSRVAAGYIVREYVSTDKINREVSMTKLMQMMIKKKAQNNTILKFNKRTYTLLMNFHHHIQQLKTTTGGRWSFFCCMLNIVAIKARVDLMSTKTLPLHYTNRRKFLKKLAWYLRDPHIKMRIKYSTPWKHQCSDFLCIREDTTPIDKTKTRQRSALYISNVKRK